MRRYWLGMHKVEEWQVVQRVGMVGNCASPRRSPYPGVPSSQRSRMDKEEVT